MYRWKETQQILNPSKDGEIFDPEWMNYSSVFQYQPPCPDWDGSRPIRFEDVDIWEVITEMSGPVGVYAAWSPYAEYYVVMRDWRIAEEFAGYSANSRLEKYLVKHGIPYMRSVS